MSDELTTALRELATEAERPPGLTGAEIRGRATGRRRRRRTAVAAAGVSVAGALALVVTLGPDDGARHEPPPAASPGPTVAPSLPVSSPDATIDLGRRVISVAGQRLTLHGDNLTTVGQAVRTTVTGKEATMRVSGRTVGFGGGYSFNASWVVRLTDPDGGTDYVGSMSYGDQGITDPDNGWINLDKSDAKLLYDRLAPGAVVEIRPSGADRGTATAGSDTATGTGSTAGSEGSGSGTSGG
ncbi:L,D-transpeptidase [Streptomyces sp. NPDC056738]|uniref:L,D-transpeptidase n=1 Tax=Streptomyces sp. NPDC056738 TaxID=3345933 RepID=UPI0036967FC5